MCRVRTLLAFLPIAVLAACAGNPYDSYPDSLYTALHDSTAEALTEHRDLLEEVLVWYDQEGRAAPPGVAAELAFYQAKLGQRQEVDALLRREVETYPDSELFVGALRRFLLGPENAPIFREQPGEESGDAGDDDD